MSLPYNQKYIVFDTETEGLNLIYSRPWQIAWSLVEGNKVIKTKNEYIDWPDLEVSDLVAKLTGFTWSEYNRRKRPPKDVWAEFRKDLMQEDRIVIGQNLIGYDIFIVATLQRLLGETPDYSYLPRIYDTRPLGKACREGIDKPKNVDMLSWQYKIMHDRSLKARVSQLAQLKHFGIDFDEKKLHDAEYDIEMTFKIFSEIKRKMNL
ncbi:3'-5' exonuclease [bacterium]|nr:3'-5' exonuclease [bacterium]